MASKQQRTAHPTRNRGGHEIHDPRTGWYSFYLAPWISISWPKLYGGDDHVYRHVCLHGGHCDRQHGVPAARKQAESSEEAEDEEGRGAGGPWRSERMVYI